ncbi:MAG: helix-turn-helix domain-containing protein [Chloroflexota bacterium]|nr:helix-turn-helix domain-containing protein [Chloroflexota bacterium]
MGESRLSTEEDHMASIAREEWLSVPDVAKRLDVSEETVRRWIRGRALPVLDLGGPKAGYRIREADLETFLSERYGLVGKVAA